MSRTWWLRILFFGVLEFVGLPGLLDDLGTWADWLKPMADLLNNSYLSWIFVISGGLVITYPQWYPSLRDKIRLLYSNLPEVLWGSELEKLNNDLIAAKTECVVSKTERDEYKGKCEDYERQVRRQDEELSALWEKLRDLKQQHGRWRIELCGSSTKSLGLSVAVQFVDPKDSALADRIRGFFWQGRGTWRNTRDIEQVRWFRNPSNRRRVVIFSGHSHAAGIKAAFNNYDLLEEKVDRFDRNSAQGKIPDVDIAIVIFPSKGPEE